MTPTERELIRKLEEQDKKDNEFSRLKYEVGEIVTSKFVEFNQGKFHTSIELNPIVHTLTEFISDKIKQEHDKARNQAIQDCIDIVSVTPGDENVIPKLESLKTIS